MALIVTGDNTNLGLRAQVTGVARRSRSQREARLALCCQPTCGFDWSQNNSLLTGP